MNEQIRGAYLIVDEGATLAERNPGSLMGAVVLGVITCALIFPIINQMSVEDKIVFWNGSNSVAEQPKSKPGGVLAVEPPAVLPAEPPVDNPLTGQAKIEAEINRIQAELNELRTEDVAWQAYEGTGLTEDQKVDVRKKREELKWRIDIKTLSLRDLETKLWNLKQDQSSRSGETSTSPFGLGPTMIPAY